MIEKNRRKKRLPVRYRWVDPEQFQTERKLAGLTQSKTADYLGVSLRTVRNWEQGSNRIPYPAFKLVRMRAKAIVHVEGWEGWRYARDGALVSPAGRSFHPWEIEQLHLAVSLARLYIQERQTTGRVVKLRAVA